LGQIGLVTTVRGRNGGLKLGVEPTAINIGHVVRETETDFHMAECFNRENNQCVYASACVLEDALSTATAAYLHVLDAVTLDKLVIRTSARSVTIGNSQPITLVDKAPIAG
jgi:Rrf2 family nitric oxide-sensitive transcriptional repressor